MVGQSVMDVREREDALWATVDAAVDALHKVAEARCWAPGRRFTPEEVERGRNELGWSEADLAILTEEPAPPDVEALLASAQEKCDATLEWLRR